MKANTLLIGLFFCLVASAADKPTPAPTSAPGATPPAEAPPAPEELSEEEQAEKKETRVSSVPEGWIPNYRYPKKPETDLFSFNFGGNIYWPQASVNVLVAKRVSVGVMPFYFDYKFQGTQSQHTGGLLTVSAYQVDDLKGLWVFAGLGFSQSKSRFLDGRAAGTQPSIVVAATVGHRWRWGHFNAGISAGGMYFEQIYVSQFRYRLGVLYPAVIYDIGFSW